MPLLVGVAVAATSAILLSGDPASAAAKSVTVSFTADGPSPASVTINPGDQVVFRNDIDPNAGSLLGVVTGTLSSVTVEVHNAARTPFSLRPGDKQSLTYTQPVRTTYTATYQPKTLLLLPGTVTSTTGTLVVRDPAGDTAPVVTPAAAPASSGGTSQGSQGSQGAPPAGTQPGGTAPAGQDGPNGQDSQDSRDGQGAPAGPQVHFTPRSGSAAVGQVPTGGTDMPAPVPIDPQHNPVSRSGTVLPQLGSAEQASPPLHRASQDSSIGSLGLPAIAAVVLLSVVSAGLVRTIMVRQATLA